MIPYQILFAAIATLIFLLGRLSASLGQATIDTDFPWWNYLFGAALAAAAYFWTAALLNTQSIFGIIVPTVAAILALLYYLGGLSSKKVEKKSRTVTMKIDSPIGKKGEITEELQRGQFLGTLVDGDSIILHSEEDLKVGDQFVVARFDEGEFIATKSMKNK